MKAVVSEASWRSGQPTLPCGHPLRYEPQRVNYYGYLLGLRPHKCAGCAVEYECIQLEGWEADQRKIAAADGRIQTCPRRVGDVGPWEHAEGLDFWEKDAWGDRESDRFPDGFPHPQTCSFCGGARPQDVLALLRLGWEVEGTTKRYKRYLHPPGYLARMDAFLAKIRVGSNAPPEPFCDPAPPVKVYSYHFTADEVEAFNALLPALGEST